jgi:hypothetical protein
MFEDACKLYEPLLCNVGTGDGKQSFLSRGMGCLVLNRFVLTCEHVLPDDGAVIVQTTCALFRADVIARGEGADCVVLQLTENTRTFNSHWPHLFPDIRRERLSIGMLLGYLTKRQDDGLNAQLAHFQAGFVSQPVVSPGARPQVALSMGSVQPGMSGSPVFDAAASLVGLLSARSDDADQLPIVQPITGLDLSALKR